jgi:hypothetical protein
MVVERFADNIGENIGLSDLPGRGLVHAVVAARQRSRGGNGLKGTMGFSLLMKSPGR